jgi:hypothetical protein
MIASLAEIEGDETEICEWRGFFENPSTFDC